MLLSQKALLFLLRVSLGWLMFYAGIAKVFDSDWNARGYLMSAQTFPGFYTWLAGPQILPVINFINAWGPILLGVSLLVGLLVQVSAPFGVLMMLLYYFPILDFPKVGGHSFLVDEHIIYAIALTVLAVFRSGEFWGLDGLIYKRSKAGLSN